LKGKIVCDSSVIVKWVSKEGEDNLEQADQVLKDCQEKKTELFAPELAKYEVANALLLGKELPTSQASISLGTVYSLPIEFIPEDFEQALNSYQFAQKFGITYYDASFVSLAELLDATLVTDDPKHQARIESVTVLPLKDYK
jgi:predicted nucleic acid-binding protein